MVPSLDLTDHIVLGGMHPLTSKPLTPKARNLQPTARYAHLNVTSPLDVAALAQVDGPAFGKLLHCGGHVPTVHALLEMFETWIPRPCSGYRD